MAFDAPESSTTADCQRHLRQCGRGHLDCLGCLFAAGYLGRLRKKAQQLCPEDAQLAWRAKCVFKHPVTGNQMSYLVANWEESGSVSVGCFICRACCASGAYGAMEVKTRNALQLCNLAGHGDSQIHRKSLETWAASHAVEPGTSCAEESAQPPKSQGLVSGISDSVPRLDRWVQALELVAACKSYGQFAAHVDAQTVGSALEPGGDTSEHVARRLIFSMAEVLNEKDRAIMKDSAFASVAIDKTRDIFLVYARVLTHAGSLYDFLLGIAECLPDVDSGAEALQQIIRRACTRAVGQRKGGLLYTHPEDKFVTEAYTRFCNSVISAVADGGTVEQRILFDSTAARLVNTQSPPLFPSCMIVTRDRPHRFRSVQKGFWNQVDLPIKELLDSLVTGNRSVARLLESSLKFGRVFQQAQMNAKVSHSAPTFAGVIKNLQYSEARFDSRSRPLFRLFRLLPIVVQCLADISSEQDDEDATWACELLESLGGEKGFNALLGAALVADTMVITQPAIRLEDAAAADWSLSGPVASELLQTLRHLLYEGGIWLEEAEGTLVHACLRSVRGKTVYIRSGTPAASAIALAWPTPLSPIIAKAKELFRIYEAFFKANFPMYEEANAFSCFNIDAELTVRDRFYFVRLLSARYSLSIDDVWRQFHGNGVSSGAWHRAVWHGSSAGLAFAASKAEASCLESEHAPETRSQKAWLSCFKELERDTPCKRLVGIYLASLSGTGTVDRWLKEVVRVMDYRPNVDPRGAQAAVKLIVQDLGGRRRTPLQGRQMLVEAVAKTAHGGGNVAHPISKFGIQAQTLYKNLFGQRRLPGRSLDAKLPQEVARLRLVADRPRMTRARLGTAAADESSEKAALQAHADSVKAAVARVKEGGEAEGPLGVIQLPQPDPKRRRIMQEAAQSANMMYTSMVTGRALGTETMPPEADDMAEHQKKAVQKQIDIANKKAEAFLRTKASVPVTYVDAKGGFMRVKDDRPSSVGPAPALPALIRAIVAPTFSGLQPEKFPNFQFRQAKTFRNSCDVVLVPDVHRNFTDPEALFARLVGARLVDSRWLAGDSEGEICFRSVMQNKHLILYIHGSFAQQHARHAIVLEAAGQMSPSMRDGKPRFDVRSGDRPEKISKPTLTYALVGDVEAATSQQKKNNRIWHLADLMTACTLVWDPPASENTSASSSSGRQCPQLAS
ncbi:unnamed protein product [Symbiodinium sp. CCMP2592]|nr:unnamed protein product [Symbiodinium sp. CCMP2592]